ncbi:uncharacterized protein Dvar_15300 [Desulfosarcina variabilis str. Montpellier]|uniref:hypothetical protein n=1 Tax=Desulfosarcina variabilis TaxID=2300 RepID=UPI003AFA24AF
MMRLSGLFLFIAFVLSVLLSFSSFSFSQEARVWTDLGLYGGQAVEIAIDPVNPDKLFAATYMGDGLFVTEDGGNTWQAVGTENDSESESIFKNHSVIAVKIAPSDNTVIWAAYNRYVAKSMDGGWTWTLIEVPDIYVNDRFCHSLAVDPSDSQTVYVGTSGPVDDGDNGAIYKTDDGGETWTKMNQFADFDFTVIDIAVDPQNSQIIWSVTNSEGTGGVFGGTLYRSGDGGENWDAIFSLTPLGGTFFAVAVKPDDSNTVFTASEGESGSDYSLGLIRHFFDGNNWNQEQPYDSDCVLDLTFDPQDSDTLYASEIDRIRKSDDGGETWQTYDNDTSFWSIAVHPTDFDVIFGGENNRGVYKGVYDGQADNYTWTPMNDGLNAVLVQDIALDPNDTTHILAGTISGLYEKKTGASWSRILESNTHSVLFHPTDSGIFYAGLQYRLAKTVDGGTTWSYWSHEDHFNSVEDITIDPTNTDTLFIAVAGYGGPYGEIHKSTDGGETFNKVLDGINRYGEEYFFNVVAIDPSDTNHIFAGGGNYFAPTVLGDLWESTNGGTDWNRTGLQFECVNDLLIDPRDSNVMYAGCGDSGGTNVPVYKSVDGGDTWVPSYQGIPGSGSGLAGLGGALGADVFCVGYDGNIFHYDGAAWTPMLSTVEEDLKDVWASSGVDVFAVGTNNTILYYDGNSWSAMANPGIPHGLIGGFRGVWGSASVDSGTGLANDVFAAGDYNTILHFNGSTWEESMGTLAAGILLDIWGSVSVAPDSGLANDVYVVGVAGNIFHYNGSTWDAMQSPTTEILYDIWGSASVAPGSGLANDVYIVGTTGTILHYNGSSWESMQSPTTEHLLGVWGSASQDAGSGLANDVFAVGNTGTILHYNGSSWIEMISPTKEDLQNVWGTSGADLFTVSGCGTIFHYDGTRWTVMRPAGASNNSVTDLDFHRQNQDVLYAGTDLQGVYVTPNQAGAWLNMGTPAYNLYAISTGSLYAATQGGLLQCTGTGLIAGRITDALTGKAIDNATVYTDLGVQCISIAGEYMMVNPSGNFSVTAIADNYKNNSEESVTVLGGNVAWRDFSMESGYPDPATLGSSDTSSSGNYCFIATATGDSPLAKIVISRATIKGFFCLCILICGLFVIRRLDAKRTVLTPLPSKYVLTITLIPIFTILIFTGSSSNAATLFQNMGIASSPNPVGSGARAMGMGGAFIGVADDATAASWNPGGIIQLEKPELSIVADFNTRKEEFSSGSQPRINNTGEVDDLELNYFSVTYPFHFHRNMVVSVNYQRLYDFKRNFSHLYDYSSAGLDLEQNKHFSQDGTLGALGLAGAVQITPKISLGATFNIWTDELGWENGWGENYSEHGVGTQGGVPVTIDTRIEDQYSNFRGINANFGLLWYVNAYLTIGAVVKTPFTAEIKHEFSYEQTQTYGAPVDDTSTTHQQFKEDVELDMPLSYGIGLAWRFSDAFSMDLDVYRTNWSEYTLTDDQGNEFSPIDGRSKSQSNVEDTTQLRIGAEYLYIMQDKNMVIPVRAGLFYDPEPSEGAPEDFYGFSVGSGIVYNRFVFDLVYQLRWGEDIDTGNLIDGSKADITQHTVLSSLIVHF